jgi:hypothetical protein
VHLLLGLLLVAALGGLAWWIFFHPAEDAPDTVAGATDRGIAFLSNGLLFLREPGGPLRQLHSPYAQEALERRERARERHGWKKGTSFGITAGGGMRDFDPADKPLAATSAAFDGNRDLLYFLKDEGIGGLFRREAGSGKELRLLLRQNLHLTHLALSPDDTIAASSMQGTGLAHICLLKKDGSTIRDVTGGDTVDAWPAWIPGSPARLLFQSSGLARNDQGYIVAQGPASLQMLNMDSGEVSPVLEDPRFDHLKPRVTPSGDLLFIRRPYEVPRYEMGNFFVDTLLFPFRLLRALFHFLNFFSLMYTRKPLTSASGPALKADLKSILLQGRRIDAEKAVRSERPVHGVPSLVPRSWQLVRRDRHGNETVLASNVASYDLHADGTVVYSNGRGVFVLQPDGSSRLAATEPFVGEVFAAA